MRFYKPRLAKRLLSSDNICDGLAAWQVAALLHLSGNTVQEEPMHVFLSSIRYLNCIYDADFIVDLMCLVTRTLHHLIFGYRHHPGKCNCCI